MQNLTKYLIGFLIVIVLAIYVVNEIGIAIKGQMDKTAQQIENPEFRR